MAFGPDGAWPAFYPKIHLFGAQSFGESTYIKPGPSSAPVVFEHGGVRFGLMTCYDPRFPELARSLADAGAQVRLVCSSWVPGTHNTVGRSLVGRRWMSRWIRWSGAEIVSLFRQQRLIGDPKLVPKVAP